jgi:hypothetical protein
MASAVLVTALGATQLTAQSLAGSADIGGSVSVGTGSTGLGADTGLSVGAKADTETAADTVSGASGTAETSIVTAAEGAIAAGNAQVVSSNNAVLGTIVAVEPDTTGQVRYTIDVVDNLGLATDRVTLLSRSMVASDGSLQIRMTGEEFATAASQRTSGAANTSSEVN